MFGAMSLQKGDIPLWNPFVSNGQPYTADPNIGFFYPIKLFISLIHFDYQIMEYLVILHYFLGGIFNFALAKDLGVGRAGSFVAGIAFMFSGFLIGQMEHINIVISASWCPLVFLFFRRAILGRNRKDIVLAGIFLSISVFGGHPQISFLISVWCGIWLVVHWFHTQGKGVVSELKLSALFFIVALALTAVQVLPTIEMITTSERGQINIAQSGAHSLPPVALALFFLPRFLGQSPNQALPFWPGYYANLNELYGYVGVTTLFLAIIGSYVRPGKDKRFLLVMAFLGIILAFGRFLPIYEYIYCIPGLRFMRAPSRFLFWVNLSLPLLAAFGIDYYREIKTEAGRKLWREAAMLAGMAVVAAAIFRLVAPAISLWQVPETHFAAKAIEQGRLLDLHLLLIFLAGLLAVFLGILYRPNYANIFAGLAILLVCLDLFQAQSTRYYVLDDPQSGYHHPEIVNYLKQRIGFLRIENTIAAGNSNWEWMAGLLHGIPMASGLPWNPFNNVNHADFQAVVGMEGSFFDFLGVKYLVTAEGETLPAAWLQNPDSSSKVDLYENTAVLPRTFMVYEAIVEPGSEDSLALIRNNAFDPAETVLLASGNPFSGTPGTAEVQILSAGNNEISIEVATTQPGYLVLSDTYYPGWRVWVNEEEAEIFRANHAFRAVFVPAGQHQIQFKFRPLIFYVGLSVTLGTILVLGTWAVIHRLRKSGD